MENSYEIFNSKNENKKRKCDTICTDSSSTKCKIRLCKDCGVVFVRLNDEIFKMKIVNIKILR